MDKKTLQAMNNFALALEELVATFETKAKEEEDFGGLGGIFSKQQDINNTITRIGEKIDNIDASNKQMLTNQEKILGMTKDIKANNESNNLFAFSNSDKSKKSVKTGVGSIILIAAGVLAIGLAFKLIGSVDFISVIALSIAMPLIAIAFTEVASSIKEKGLGLKDMLMSALALTVMAMSLTASSWILSYVQPIGFSQFITAVAISAIFVVLSYAIAEAMRPLKKVNVKQVIMLPIVFVSMSLALMLSSHILGMSSVVEPGLLFNLILQSITLSIMAIAMSLPMILFKGLGLKPKDVMMGGLMLVMVAATMMTASWLINLGTYDNYPSLLWAIGTGLAINLMAIPIIALGLLSMTGVGLAAIALGSVATMIVAGTIVAVSYILSSGDYGSYPGIGWALGVGTSLGLFGISMVSLGFIMLTGIGAFALGFGAGAMLTIADTIVNVADILNGGDFTGGPTPTWAKGVGMAIGAFAPVFATLSSMNIWSIFGGSKFSAEDYANTITTISMAIITAADVFRNGPTRWEGGPTKKWAEGVGLAIGAFAPIFKILNSQGIMDSLFGTTVTAEDMGSAIRMIATSIMDAADIFSKDNGSYKGGPTKKWAEGVGQSITSFSKIYEWVFDGLNWTPGDIEQANGVIFKIARSILDVAKIFQGYEMQGDKLVQGVAPKWGGFPTKKWSDGVTGSIMKFSELYDWVFDGDNWTPEYIDQANAVIYKVARSILQVGRIMEPLGNMTLPAANAAGDLAKNLKTWKDVVKVADELDTGNLFMTAFKIKFLASGVDKLAKALNGLGAALSSLQTNQLDALNNIAGTFISFSVMDEDNFASIMDVVDDKSESLAKLFGTAKENLDQSASADNFAWSDPSSWFGGSTPEISQPEKDNQKNLNDVYAMLESMDGKLAQISKSSSNLSNYVNELRSNPEVRIK